MIIPQYPQPTANVTAKGYYPKLPYNNLVDIYDNLTALGLYVVPKQVDKKLPVWKYWKKEGRVEATRTLALKDQKLDSVSGWCVVTGAKSGRLVVLDFDTAEILKYGADPVNIYNKVQSLSPNAFVFSSPANGLHMYYRVPEDLDMLTNAKPPIRGVDIRGEGGQVVSLGGWNRYDDDIAQKKGVDDGHTGTYQKVDFGRYGEVPIMSTELYEWITTPQTKPKSNNVRLGENYGHTPKGRARVESHFKQGLDERVQLTLECLSHILDHWEETAEYELWYQMWMSAHHASDGSHVVRDFILDHPTPYWRDEDRGRRDFIQKWDAHEHREDEGYTISSMFWLAKQAGWLSTTGYEIPKGRVEEIFVRYIGEWFDELQEVPKRLLLQSQTGSGKTYNIARLWTRLGKPKSVVFVPSIKLATELANTLRIEHGIPATLYRDSDTGETRSSAELADAEFLVTTLQTFGTKVYSKGYSLSNYGLVYIEESDQLLAQFARGGGGRYGTHVKNIEAINGYNVIRDAMKLSEYVWCVDATMSLVTYDVATWLLGTTPFEVIRNTYISPKPEVQFVEEKTDAFQAVLDGLNTDKRVVVACDTKTDSSEIYETMEHIGVLDNKSAILINGATERQPKVIEFMSNVNKYAQQYDLIIYNSVMASGVSITSVVPDLVVQIARYLTPRNNLQILNRFRRQNEVICWYVGTENLYAQRATQIMEDARDRINIESTLINMPVAQRNDMANLRSHITSLSVADDEIQFRSARDMYTALLKTDGRDVSNVESLPTPAILEHTIEGVRAVRKQQKEYIARNWRSVEPIDNDRPARPEYTDMEVALGETHATIERVLRGNIPDDSDLEVYEIVYEYKSYAYLLSMYVQQIEALKRAETALADKTMAITSLSNNLTVISVVTLVHHLFHSPEEVLDSETLAIRAPSFLKALSENVAAYDSIVGTRQKYRTVSAKYQDDREKLAYQFAKIILKKIGLKLRSQRDNRVGGVLSNKYSIANIDTAQQFLEWRNGDDIGKLELTTAVIEDRILSRQEAVEIYQNLPLDKQQEVMVILASEDNTDFQTAVLVVKEGAGW